jgi:hypothetical protein
MGDCLREVSQHRKSVSCSREDFDDLVATAFLMDAYPPGMHGKFDFFLLALSCLDLKAELPRFLAHLGFRRIL